MKLTSHCPICRSGADGAAKVHQRKMDAIRRCAACGSLFSNPRPEPEELDELYRREFYRDDGTQTSHEIAQDSSTVLHRTILRLLMRKYPHVVRPGASVLDYGCGRGRFLAEAATAGLNATGIELSDAAARFARDELNLDVRTGHEDALAKLPNEAFELVTCFEVLEHTIDPRKTAALLAEKLAPGGVLAISYPNIGCWRYRLQGARWFNMANPTHLNFFSLAAMRRMLGDMGLIRVRRMVYYGGRPGFGPIRSALQYLVRALNLGSDVRIFATK